jgi:uncharacterized protein YdeI (YjbR/CyaY-like superfamily)
MKAESTETFYPKSRKHWRSWLEKNHAKKQSIWLICYKKHSNMPTISWSEGVDEALCFGWIDSKRKPIDAEKFIQYFSKRKPTGTWSKINKRKIEQLIADGLMTKAGYQAIEAAKKNGSWSTLDDVEELKIPADLDKAFRKHAGSKKGFLTLTHTQKRNLLQWLVLAKRPETRQKRIDRLVELVVK